MSTIDVAANLRAVQESIADACRRAGRAPSEVLLIGVSKTVDLDRIRAAIAAGVPALGENRVQEAKDKVEALGRPVPWHLIGSLQTNKARDAVRLFDCIHSVDRLDLARELDRRAQGLGRTLDGLLQVNLGDEPQKGGAAEDDVKRLRDDCVALSHLKIVGLMAIPPHTEVAEGARPYFKRLRALRDSLGLPHLSMGMSADYAIAIEEGATMVRVGTAVFGPRTRPA
jgi:pyridoxal phosphate enzyme (YggS family)